MLGKGVQNEYEILWTNDMMLGKDVQRNIIHDRYMVMSLSPSLPSHPQVIHVIP